VIDVANNHLTARMHVDMLDNNLLLTFATVAPLHRGVVGCDELRGQHTLKLVPRFNSDNAPSALVTVLLDLFGITNVKQPERLHGLIRDDVVPAIRHRTADGLFEFRPVDLVVILGLAFLPLSSCPRYFSSKRHPHDDKRLRSAFTIAAMRISARMSGRRSRSGVHQTPSRGGTAK
jgi:hypothetical protein